MSLNRFYALIALLMINAVVMFGCGSRNIESNEATDLTFELKIKVHSIEGESSNIPIENVRACWYDDSAVPCATTDADGKAIMHLPLNVVGRLEFTHPDYLHTFYYIRTSLESNSMQTQFELWGKRYMEGLFSSMNIEYQREKSIIGFGTHVAGANVDIDPRSGTGPVYIDTGWTPNPNLENTSDLGAAGFVNVDPAQYRASATIGDTNCLGVAQI